MNHDFNLPPDIENRLFEYARETRQDLETPSYLLENLLANINEADTK